MSCLKRWIRDGLSLSQWVIGRLSRRPAVPSVRILVYHSIAAIRPRQDRWRMSVPPGLFAAQLRWLRQHGYTIVSLGEALEMVRGRRPMPAQAVAVTFDDGFCDTFQQAYPLLRSQQVPATVFVVPRYLDAASPFPWLERPEVFGRPLAWKELQQLVSDPLMSVGSHTWSHRQLSDLSIDEQRQEIEQSKVVLEARLGHAVKWLAYPYGHVDSLTEETIRCLQQAGFEAACVNVMGVNQVGDSPWVLRRTRIGWEDCLWRFRLKMTGAYDWVDQWRHQSVRLAHGGRRFGFASKILWMGMGLYFFTPSNAYAYIDPGYGSLIWQALLASLFGGLFFARKVIAQAISWIRGKGGPR